MTSKGMTSVENYSLYLKVITPLHIGSNDLIDFCSFFVDINNSCIKLFNIHDFLNTLNEEQYNNFYKLITTSNDNRTKNIAEIFRWIQSRPKVLPFTTIKADKRIVEKIYDIIKRQDDFFLHENFISRTYTSNYPNIHNSFYQPIIPGSSIKGIIRTALLNFKLKAKPEGWDFPNHRMQAYLLDYQNQARFDPFRNIKCSDFQAVGLAETTISNNSYEHTNSNFITYYETINKGNIFRGNIVLNREKSSNNSISFQQIIEALNDFYSDNKPNFTDGNNPLAIIQLGRGSDSKPLFNSKRKSYNRSHSNGWIALYIESGEDYENFNIVNSETSIKINTVLDSFNSSIKAERENRLNEQKTIIAQREAREKAEKLTGAEKALFILAQDKISEVDAVNIFNDLKNFKDTELVEIATGLKKFYKLNNKWGGKISEKQQIKVDKIRQIIGE
jgi:CRISPR/Cas system CSM-associated protein Csm5 (group 7 of RAMP superfamily)